MKLLKENGIVWNNQLEVKQIPGSNIVDLITEALVRRKRRAEPFGWQHFIRAIAESNIPTSFFTKTSTIEDI